MSAGPGPASSTTPCRALSRSISTVWDAYSALLDGAVGSPGAWSETLLRATPLIFAGLAVAFAFKAALFNIGANGQLIMGAMAAGWVSFTLDVPGPLVIPVALALGILGGALWGGIAGALKAATGAHEVITTIMLNFIAFHLLLYVLSTTGLPAGRRRQPGLEEGAGPGTPAPLRRRRADRPRHRPRPRAQ